MIIFTIINIYLSLFLQAEGVWEHGVEENIWTEEGRVNGGMEDIA